MLPEYNIFNDNVKYSIKVLSDADESSVQNLCEMCSDFFLLIEGRLPEKDAGHEILFDLPPGKDSKDKFVLGVCKEDGSLIAVIDMIKDFKVPGEWCLGLLMIDPDERGNGIGRSLHEFIKAFVLKSQGKVLRIGVIEENYGAHKFWMKMGYTEVDRIKGRYGNKEQVAIVMNLQLA